MNQENETTCSKSTRLPPPPQKHTFLYTKWSTRPPYPKHSKYRNSPTHAKCLHGQNAHQVKRQHILDTQCLDCHNQCGQITSLNFRSVISLKVCVIVFRIQSITGFAYKTHNQSIKSRERIDEWHFCKSVIDDIGDVGYR